MRPSVFHPARLQVHGQFPLDDLRAALRFASPNVLRSKCGAGLGFCIPAWKKTFSFLTTMTEEEDAGNTNSWSHEWWDVCGDPMLCTCCHLYAVVVPVDGTLLSDT